MESPKKQPLYLRGKFNDRKRCSKCRVIKLLEHFIEEKHRFCRDCRPSLKNSKKLWWETKRRKVLTHYGNRCARCGFTDQRALSIDHVEGGGAEHRRNLKSNDICAWLMRNNFPPGFQILCMNCQWIKRHENQEQMGSRKRNKPA
jgi:hypothetical protein